MPILRICIPAKIHTHTKCVMSLFGLLNNFEALTGYRLDIKFLCGKSNIDQARSMMATDFYNDCGPDDLMLFIDSDHVFNIKDIQSVIALIKQDTDVAIGVYSNSIGQPTSFFVNPEDFFDGKDNRILYAGTGFMCIKHNTLKILAADCEKKGVKWANISKEYPRVIPFFKQRIIDSEVSPGSGLDWLGEDFSFCKTVRDCGMVIRGFLTNSLGHEVPNIRIFYPECNATKNGLLLPPKKHFSAIKDNNLIVYYCGFSRAQFNSGTKNGGSEQAIFNTIEDYPNNLVEVYGNVIPENKLNYKLIPATQFKLNEEYETVILWRGFGLNILPLVKANNIYIDLHDCTNPDLLPINLLNKIDKVWFKSQWHRQMYSYIPDEKTVIKPNKISKIYYEVAKFNFKKVPFRICYTSCYSRGLVEQLENCWPKIRATFPKAEFHIAYGMELLQDIELVNKLNKLLKFEGVINHGRLTNYETAVLQATSQIHFYLCNNLNIEIDCLAVRESKLLNCEVVMFDGGVFKEREGHHVPVGDYFAATNLICKLLGGSGGASGNE